MQARWGRYALWLCHDEDDGRMGRWKDGFVDHDEWGMHGLIDVRMDGWMDGQTGGAKG